jgi:hypothetical protein
LTFSRSESSPGVEAFASIKSDLFLGAAPDQEQNEQNRNWYSEQPQQYPTDRTLLIS